MRNIVKAHAGISDTESHELDWTAEQYQKFLDEDKELESEVRGAAYELVDLEFWVEEAKDEL